MVGIADILGVTAPSTVAPSEPFEITVSVKNIGDLYETFFIKLYDVTGGGSTLILEITDGVNPNETEAYPFFFPEGILTSTDFHIEAGHIAVSCEDYTDESTCTANGCYWYDGACHSAPANEICTWVTDKGGPTGLDITEVFEFIDSYILQTPPTGYTFVPTITETMGIIDYYLGFITSGNTNTGCSF